MPWNQAVDGAEKNPTAKLYSMGYSLIIKLDKTYVKTYIKIIKTQMNKEVNHADANCHGGKV